MKKRLILGLPLFAALLALGIFAVYARTGGYMSEVAMPTPTFDFTQAPVAPREDLVFMGWMQPGQACNTSNNTVSNQGEFTQAGKPDLMIDPINKQTSPVLKTMSSTLQVIDGIIFSYEPNMGDNVAVWQQNETAPKCAITTIP